jgi:hypothetical protein
MPRTAKRHDTLDPITGTATKNGSPVDLTVFTSVTFFALHEDGQTIITGLCSDANSDGTWEYQQDDADMSLAGDYSCELECVAPGGKVHFPSSQEDNPVLTVDPDVDDN